MIKQKLIKKLETQLAVKIIGEPIPMWTFYAPSFMDVILLNKSPKEYAKDYVRAKELYLKDCNQWIKQRKEEFKEIEQLEKRIKKLKNERPKTK